MGFTHVRTLIAGALFTLLFAAPLVAHEIGTTDVRATFPADSTYRIDVTTGPETLLRKLEARARVARSRDLDDTQLHAAISRFAPALGSAVNIHFGSVRVQPAVAVLPIRDGAITVRFTGNVPRTPAPFTFQYTLASATYALTIQTPHNAPVRYWINGDETSTPVPLDRVTRVDIVRQYLVLGFTHILPLGLDHILFVLGMFLLSSRLKPVLTQVTAFTVAHSITLALSINGIVNASPRIVEPLIALSIAYVAIENLTTTQLKPWRIAIVFAFGLLHGLGFAGVLRDLGIPRAELATALIAFNVGVELGQLAVIAAAWVLVVSWAQSKPWYRRRLLVPASIAIAAMGLIWTFERL
ncbi:MAG TPA: HupE/UreJ family protein [Thermoanaerobaculia bacterium]